jgi:hypothetical protein
MNIYSLEDENVEGKGVESVYMFLVKTHCYIRGVGREYYLVSLNHIMTNGSSNLFYFLGLLNNKTVFVVVFIKIKKIEKKSKPMFLFLKSHLEVITYLFPQSFVHP